MVKEDLDRARKTAFGSRDALRVFEVGTAATDDYTRSADYWNPREIYHSGALGRVLSVGGKRCSDDRRARS